MPAFILDSQHHTLQTQANWRDMLLDGDCPEAIHAEGGHHGSHKCTWGEGPHEALQRAEQIRR
ncbi:hypothetical protein [Prevotella sp. P2-180]|uniref:hypothetical protein n=1 Tax=Prevotella sp. P2-180 TaxID=2024224 RepID=UPI001556E69B|nr:hypothetical protein [Prevotella sp. P2-180]